MKKILIILISLLVCLTLTACQNDNDNPSPIYKCESLEEINRTANVHLVKPGVMGISDEKFIMRDNNTAEYVYYLKGYKYYMRGCKDTTIDMSGVFNNNAPAFDDCLDEEIAFKEVSGYKVYRFLLGDKQYIFGVEDQGSISKDEFEIQFNEIYQQVMYDSTFKEISNLIGEYIDKQSQRATLTTKLIDVNLLEFNIMWPNTSSETEQWITKATYDGVQFLYNAEDIIHNSIIYSTDGTPTIQQIDDSEKGCFEFVGGEINWITPINEQTPKCVFERNN